MVKFNKSVKPIKPKKTTKSLSHSGSAVKPNKPKIVYEKSFLKARYISALSLIFMGLIALVTQAAYVQIVNADSLIDETVNFYLSVYQCILWWQIQNSSLMKTP